MRKHLLYRLYLTKALTRVLKRYTNDMLMDIHNHHHCEDDDDDDLGGG